MTNARGWLLAILILLAWAAVPDAVDANEPTPAPSTSPAPIPGPNGCRDQCDHTLIPPMEDIGEAESCHEDDPCWDCTSMGNGTCGPLPPDAYPDGAGQPPLLPDTRMSREWDEGQQLLYVIGSALFIVGLRLVIRSLYR